MTSTIVPLTATAEQPPIWRGFLRTFVSYLKWGYGALLVFAVADGVYELVHNLFG